MARFPERGTIGRPDCSVGRVRGWRRCRQIRPELMKTFSGYAVHTVVTNPLPGVWDMAADSAGGVAVLTTERDSWSIRRLDSEGEEVGSWRLQVPLQPHGMRIASAPDGTLAVLGSELLVFFDTQGRERAPEVEIGSGHFTDIVFDADREAVDHLIPRTCTDCSCRGSRWRFDISTRYGRGEPRSPPTVP